jgi:hypothetical protein
MNEPLQHKRTGRERYCLHVGEEALMSSAARTADDASTACGTGYRICRLRAIRFKSGWGGGGRLPFVPPNKVSVL